MIIVLLSKYVCIVRMKCLNNSSFTMRRCNRFYLELSKKKEGRERERGEKKGQENSGKLSKLIEV